MKKKFIIYSLLLSAFVCGSASAKQPLASTKKSQQPLDQIVAIVNDDVVTKTELNHALVTTKMQMTQAHMPIPAPTVLTKQLLEQLINQKLQLQIAKQAGVHVTDTDLDGVINNIAKQNSMTVEELYKRLQDEGMSSTDYRNEMRDQLTIHKLQQQEIASHIHISKDEVSHFLKSHSWKAQAVNEYHLEDLLVPISDAPSADEIMAAKNHADDVMNKLHQGQDFTQLVQSESANQAAQSGDLGWRKIEELPEAFAEQVSHMKLQEVAGPIETANGFHILHLVDMRSATSNATPTPKQAEDMLIQQKLEEAIRNWVSKLRAQAFIVTNPDK